MKKVLFINRHNLSITGGIEMHISKFIERLDKSKYQVTVLSLKENKKALNDEMSQELKIFSFLTYDYTKYDIIFIENFNILPHFIIIIKLFILKILHKNTYKVIFVPHGGFVPYWEMFSPIPRIIKKIYHKIVGAFFTKHIVDEVVAVSKWEKSVLENIVTKNIHLIGNGMAKISIDLKNIKKEEYFIFIGRINPIKDIIKILKTFDEIKRNKKFRNYKLYIAGPYNVNDGYYKELVRLIGTLKIINDVKLIGAKYNKDKYELLARAQCLFCMSKFETDPIVVKEALSVKTKVCISPNYGLNDYVDVDNVFTIYNTKNIINTNKFYNFINSEFTENRKDILTWDKMKKKYEELF